MTIDYHQNTAIKNEILRTRVASFIKLLNVFSDHSNSIPAEGEGRREKIFSLLNVLASRT